MNIKFSFPSTKSDSDLGYSTLATELYVARIAKFSHYETEGASDLRLSYVCSTKED